MAAVLVKVAYGDALSEEQTQALFRANKEALAVWFSAERPLLKLLLDLVPCCMSININDRAPQNSQTNIPLYSVRHIPKWLPGVAFKKEAAQVHKLVDHIRFASWGVVLEDMVERFLNNGPVF